MRLVLLFLALSTTALAQDNSCGGTLTSVEDTVPLQYPPIARAAHIQGDVVLLASFKTTGQVDRVEVVSGPPILRDSATSYIQGWHANEYTGPRTCPITIRYTFGGDYAPGEVHRIDAQHVVITATLPVTYTVGEPMGCPVGWWYRLRRSLHLLRRPCPSLH